MVIKSIISWGFVDLMETFFKANNLDVRCEIRSGEGSNKITFEYDDNSDTDLAISYMSIKHLGFENMLCDYLVRLGYPPGLISIGRTVIKRDMKELDKAWEERRRELGFR